MPGWIAVASSSSSPTAPAAARSPTPASTATRASDTIGNTSRAVGGLAAAGPGADGARPPDRRRGRAARAVPRGVPRPHGGALPRQGHHHRPLGDDGDRAEGGARALPATASRPRSSSRSCGRPACPGSSGTGPRAGRRSSRSSARSTSAPGSPSSTPRRTRSSRSPRTRRRSRSRSCTAGAAIARRQLDPHRVARVIARPFVGTPGKYVRTYHRKDFSIATPGTTVLERLVERGRPGVRRREDPGRLRPARDHRRGPHRGERGRAREDRGAPRPRGPRARVREPRGLRHALRPPERPARLRARARGDGPRAAAASSGSSRRARSARSPPTTAAIRPRPRPTTRASTCRCSSTPRGAAAASSGRGRRSRTSARPSPSSSGCGRTWGRASSRRFADGAGRYRARVPSPAPGAVLPGAAPTLAGAGGVPGPGSGPAARSARRRSSRRA